MTTAFKCFLKSKTITTCFILLFGIQSFAQTSNQSNIIQLSPGESTWVGSKHVNCQANRNGRTNKNEGFYLVSAEQQYAYRRIDFVDVTSIVKKLCNNSGCGFLAGKVPDYYYGFKKVLEITYSCTGKEGKQIVRTFDADSDSSVQIDCGL